MDNLDTVILHSQAVEMFNRFILPLVQQGMEQDGEPDYIARSEAWSNWKDSLCTGGEISTWQNDNWSHPASCGD